MGHSLMSGDTGTFENREAKKWKTMISMWHEELASGLLDTAIISPTKENRMMKRLLVPRLKTTSLLL